MKINEKLQTALWDGFYSHVKIAACRSALQADKSETKEPFTVSNGALQPKKAKDLISLRGSMKRLSCPFSWKNAYVHIHTHQKTCTQFQGDL